MNKYTASGMADTTYGPTLAKPSISTSRWISGTLKPTVWVAAMSGSTFM